MSSSNIFQNINEANIEKVKQWKSFLEKQSFDFSTIQKIDMLLDCPVIYDLAGNKFSIDFINNKINYHKKKQSLKTELISRALGAGRSGLNILDLSAGLGVDAVFLAQLGYNVVALERNPLIYLALSNALGLSSDLKLTIHFGDALEYLKSKKLQTDVIYFDPMFPEKTKSALPRQEMVFFKNLVGSDLDANDVLQLAVNTQGVKRVVIKRPLKAPFLGLKPISSVEGKLIRFDIYGVKL